MGILIFYGNISTHTSMALMINMNYTVNNGFLVFTSLRMKFEVENTLIILQTKAIPDACSTFLQTVQF